MIDGLRPAAKRFGSFALQRTDNRRARGEHSAGPAPNDRMATMRLLRRKLKAAAMTVMGQERRFGHIEPMSVLPPFATAIATCQADAKCQ
jgi:hypothetical protein